MNLNLKNFDPAVDKKYLVAVSGTLWTIIGLLLCSRAVDWLSDTTVHNAVWPAVAGSLLALAIYYFGFVKIAEKNIKRILAKKGKICIFAFQPWKSYIIIIVMINLGSALRHSSLPLTYLSIVYIGFGGAMLLSSFKYHVVLIKELLS